MSADTDLVLDHVEIARDGMPFLALSATIRAGAVLTIMGPSGSGKSTLLAYVAGFLRPPFVARGTVRIGTFDLTRLPAAERRVGLLFQDALLFPHLSVGGNIRFALPASVKRAARAEAVDNALTEVGLAGNTNRDPATLSGGEQARVALARVLSAQPRALLLDEPFSKLDAALKAQIRQLVFDTARERRLPVLLVTHDPDDAQAAGGAVVRLDEN
ncbi:ATP-binding cassette domain-containing protein [Amorphus sp. 3PC139-8]|uniref:ATP-binding cassette domain-containing protein n=1 Tax=Amorphus sp. 3PC139-8 TaxID=2735676 RepID=UPI00345D22D3